MLALSRACLISSSAVVEEVTRKALYKAPVGISYTVIVGLLLSLMDFVLHRLNVLLFELTFLHSVHEQPDNPSLLSSRGLLPEPRGHGDQTAVPVHVGGGKQLKFSQIELLSIITMRGN